MFWPIRVRTRVERLLQFRVGIQKLHVNRRKSSNVPRNERLYTICDEGVLGNDIHFVYECTKLDDLRTK